MEFPLDKKSLDVIMRKSVEGDEAGKMCQRVAEDRARPDSPDRGFARAGTASQESCGNHPGAALIRHGRHRYRQNEEK